MDNLIKFMEFKKTDNDDEWEVPDMEYLVLNIAEPFISNDGLINNFKNRLDWLMPVLRKIENINMVERIEIVCDKTNIKGKEYSLSVAYYKDYEELKSVGYGSSIIESIINGITAFLGETQ